MTDDSSLTPQGLRKTLREPGPVFCGFVSFPDPGVAAIVGWAGFDFVLLDLEHGPFSPLATRSCIDALATTPAKTVIRIADNDPTLIKQALDLGADGLCVPMVSNADDAQAAVQASRYSPDGFRGLGAGHATRYGTNLPAYFAEANARTAVIATIETAGGVENAAEIARVDGLDAIIVGPGDLSVDLGIPLDTLNPRVTEAIAHVVEEGRKAGIRVGTGCSAERVSEVAKTGPTMFACFFDGDALGQSAATAISAARTGWEESGSGS
jgi:2-keto-3-deoxy-L-rhamnonate aldolase RhmA